MSDGRTDLGTDGWRRLEYHNRFFKKRNDNCRLSGTHVPTDRQTGTCMDIQTYVLTVGQADRHVC